MTHARLQFYELMIFSNDNMCQICYDLQSLSISLGEALLYEQEATNCKKNISDEILERVLLCTTRELYGKSYSQHPCCVDTTVESSPFFKEIRKNKIDNINSFFSSCATFAAQLTEPFAF